jgi:hypothetical protein
MLCIYDIPLRTKSTQRDTPKTCKYMKNNSENVQVTHRKGKKEKKRKQDINNQMPFLFHNISLIT